MSRAQGLIVALKRRNQRLRSLSSIGSIDGEGWGEGAARQMAVALRIVHRIPLTQSSPPSTLGGEGLKRGVGFSPADSRRTP